MRFTWTNHSKRRILVSRVSEMGAEGMRVIGSGSEESLRFLEFEQLDEKPLVGAKVGIEKVQS